MRGYSMARDDTIFKCNRQIRYLFFDNQMFDADVSSLNEMALPVTITQLFSVICANAILLMKIYFQNIKVYYIYLHNNGTSTLRLSNQKLRKEID